MNHHSFKTLCTVIYFRKTHRNYTIDTVVFSPSVLSSRSLVDNFRERRCHTHGFFLTRAQTASLTLRGVKRSYSA